MTDVQQQPGTARGPGAAQQRSQEPSPVPAGWARVLGITVAAISAAHGRELTDQT